MQLRTPDRSDTAALLSLAARAEAPWSAFVYDSPSEGTEIAARLLSEGLGECPFEACRLAFEGLTPVGLVAGRPGAIAARARLRSALALARGAPPLNPKVQERLQIAARTLVPLASDDYYLARLAVAEGAEKRGVGKAMLEACQIEALRLGCARIVLELSPLSPRAAQLYARAGFEEIGHASVCAPDRRRRLEYLHLALPLAEKKGAPA